MLGFGFIQSLNDFSLFMYVKDSVNVFAFMYVDDILITEDCVSIINSFKKFVDDKFKIKDLGTLHYFIGIEVVSIADGICFNKKKRLLSLFLNLTYLLVNLLLFLWFKDVN